MSTAKRKQVQQEVAALMREDKDYALIARDIQAAEPPMPPLIPPQVNDDHCREIAVGDTVCYFGDINNKWTVTAVRGAWITACKGNPRSVERVEQNFIRIAMVPLFLARQLPAEVSASASASVVRPTPGAALENGRKQSRMTARQRSRPASPTPLGTRPRTVADEIAARLREADTLDDLWLLAVNLGVPTQSRERCTHMNKGLQRMWIGNWLRKHPDEAKANIAAKQGQEPKKEKSAERKASPVKGRKKH